MNHLKKIVAITAAVAAAGAAVCAFLHLFHKKNQQEVCKFYDFNEDVEAEICPQA